ncbi:MAG: FAD-dependent oxidoreductase [Oscillospiraceae bacterium]
MVAPVFNSGKTGMFFMRVMPVISAIENNSRTASYDEISTLIENATAISVGPCSCRRTRRIMGEGCGHLEKDVCIFFNEFAEYHIRSGHRRDIDREECYEILRRAEENGLVHEISNLTRRTAPPPFATAAAAPAFRCALRSTSRPRTPSARTTSPRWTRKSASPAASALRTATSARSSWARSLRLALASAEVRDPHEKLLWFGEKNYDADYRTDRGYVASDGTAPCKTKCPAHIPVQGYIKLASQGRFDEALEPSGARTPSRRSAAVCAPASARRPAPAATWTPPSPSTRSRSSSPSASSTPPPAVKPKMLNTTGKPYTNKIAVIGAGPAGLSCAYYLALQGYPVTVFEKLKNLGGMLTMGIPSFRLEKDVVKAEIEILKDLGVEFKTGVEVGKDVTLDGAAEGGLRGVLRRHRRVEEHAHRRPGEKLKGVMAGIDFLRRTNSSRKPSVGENVAVIGGGNVAIDVARSAVRLGAKHVTVVYRRTEAEMPADAEEVAEARGRGREVQVPRRARADRGQGRQGRCAEAPGHGARRSRTPAAGASPCRHGRV